MREGTRKRIREGEGERGKRGILMVWFLDRICIFSTAFKAEDARKWT